MGSLSSTISLGNLMKRSEYQSPRAHNCFDWASLISPSGVNDLSKGPKNCRCALFLKNYPYCSIGEPDGSPKKLSNSLPCSANLSTT